MTSNITAASALDESASPLTNGEGDVNPLPTGLIIEVVLKSLIYVIGVVGNVLVISLILLLKEYKKVSHWYVLQLALADFIFLQTLPFNISQNIVSRWIYPLWACKASQTALFLNYYSSILFLTIMAVDRYLAVCHGLTNTVQSIRSNNVAYAVTACTWIVSLFICIPVIMYSDIVGAEQIGCLCTIYFPKDPYEWCTREGFNASAMDDCVNGLFTEVHRDSCMPSTFGNGTDFYDYSGDSQVYGSADGTYDSDLSDPVGSSVMSDYSSSFSESASDTSIEGQCKYDTDMKGWTAFLLFNFIVMFVIPFLIIATCYLLIIRRLAKTVHGSSKNQQKKRVTIMCAVLVILFVVCWLPFHSVHLAKILGIKTGQQSGLCTILADVTSILAYVNSALNPYLYNFLGSFKKRVRQLREHKAFKNIASATGLTRIASGANSRTCTIDESKLKPTSGVSEVHNSAISLESQPLKTFGEATT